ncbi:unnamed protein product [Orchesella dallaii]|uniref:Ionotropic glutamate receptor C-terminal domain-containing protein n=1 Tax=Orchesella dallaii TaxID=48710 RepID=A0ABP1RED7_9HEXA
MGDIPPVTSSLGKVKSSENTPRKSLNRTNSTTNSRGRTGSVTFDETTLNISPEARRGTEQLVSASQTPSQHAIPTQIIPKGATSPANPQNRRQSGLFSPDDVSIDESAVVALDQPRLQDLVTTGILAPPAGDGPEVIEKQHPPHPMSVAGSSIGGSIMSYENISASELRKKKRRKKWRRFRRKYKGCLFAMASSFVSSLANYTAHDLLRRNKKFSPSFLLACRYTGVLLPGIFIALYFRYFNKEPIFDPVWPLKAKEQIKKFLLSIARVIVDVLSIFLNYEAFKYLLQSEASTILNSKPVVVQLLAHITLGEPWGVVPILMSLVVSFGVFVISKPPFLDGTSTHSYVEERLPGIGLAVISMLLAAVVYIILRYLKDIHFSVVSLFIGSGGIVFGVVYTWLFTEFVIPASKEEVFLLIALAFLVCLSSITIVIALQNEEAFVVSLALQSVPNLINFNEDAQFIVYFSSLSSQTKEDKKLIKYLLKNPREFPFSGVPLILAADGSLQLVCFFCSTLNQTSRISSLTKTREIEKLWMNLHRDFNGMEVFRGGQIISKHCWHPAFISPGSTNRCNLEIMRQKLNLTLVDSESRISLNKQDILTGVTLTLNLAKALKNKRNFEMSGFEIPLPGISSSRYAFIIISRNGYTHEGLSAVMLPFQKNTWIAIIVSLIAVPAALRIATTTCGHGRVNEKIKAKTYWEWLFLAFSAMLDQCSESMSHFLTSPQASGLWLLWNFYSLVIMNVYDGELFSFLASYTTQNTPDTLVDLANSPYNIVTIDTTLNTASNGSKFGTSHLQNFLEPVNSTVTLPIYYKILSTKLHFLSLTKNDHNELVEKILKLSSEHPRGIAFVDKEDNIRTFDPIFDLALKVRVIKRNNINNVHLHSAWIIRNYCFVGLFRNILWQTVEAGLKDYWDTNSMLKTQVFGIRRKLQLQKQQAVSQANKTKIGTTFETSYNLFGYLLQSMNGVTEVLDGGDDGRVNQAIPISLGLIESVLELALVMLCISSVVLLLEKALKTVPNLINFNEDAQFIVYFSPFSSETKDDNKLIKYLTKYSREFPFSGVPLILAADGSLQLVCFFCSILNQTRMISSLTKTREIEKLWKNLHRDFNGMKVFRGGQIISQHCWDPAFISPGPTIQCNLEIMRQKLNLTLVESKILDVNNQDIVTGITLTPTLVRILRVRRNFGISGFEISLPGISLSRYAFIIISRNGYSHEGLSAVMLPFQKNTWLAIIVSLIAVPAALWVATTTCGHDQVNEKITTKTYWEWLFLAFSVMLDQCSESMKHFLTSPQASGIWLLWNFYSLVIMNVYDGELFSFLASYTTQKTPDTLVDLANSPYNIVTIDTTLTFIATNGSNVDTSYLQDFLEPVKSVNSEVILPKYYKVLSRKLHFLSLTKNKQDQLVEKILKLSSEHPRGIAFVDREFNIRMFDPMLDLALKVRVIKRKNINDLQLHRAWRIRIYCFVGLFRNILWQTVEAGLKDYWDRNSMLKTQVFGIRRKLQLQKQANKTKIGTTFETSYNLFGYLLQSMKGGTEVLDGGDDGRVNQAIPISLGLIESVLKLTVGMLCISLVVLFLESVYLCVTEIQFRIIWYNYMVRKQ